MWELLYDKIYFENNVAYITTDGSGEMTSAILDAIGEHQNAAFVSQRSDGMKTGRAKNIKLPPAVEKHTCNREIPFKERFVYTCTHAKNVQSKKQQDSSKDVYVGRVDSRKTGCDFKIRAYKSRYCKLWIVPLIHSNDNHPLFSNLPLAKTTLLDVKELIASNPYVEAVTVREMLISKYVTTGKFRDPEIINQLRLDKNERHRYVPSIQQMKKMVTRIRKELQPISNDLFDFAGLDPTDSQAQLVKTLTNKGYNPDGEAFDDGFFGQQKVKVQFKTADTDFAVLMVSKFAPVICAKYLPTSKTLFIDLTHNTNKAGFQLGQIRVATNIGYLALLTFVTETATQKQLSAIIGQWTEMIGIDNIGQHLKTVVSDMAMEEIGAFREHFPNAQVHYCGFHVAQAFVRRFEKLKQPANDDAKLLVLALEAAKSPISSAELKLRAELERVDQKSDFGCYLWKNYVSEDARYKPKYWCRHYLMQRPNEYPVAFTNNACETNFRKLKAQHQGVH